jgi:hypothetical protein
MSKVKQWAEDTAEKAVDKIFNELKNNAISKEAAKAKIMNVDNLDLVGIDEHNVDEVIDIELDNSVYKNQAERNSELGII